MLFRSDVNVNTGYAFKINSTSVLSATTLGSGVTSSSLTSVGTLTSLAVSGTTGLNGVTYTWPASAGSNGQMLTSNGAGTLSWTTPTAGVTGSGTTGTHTKWTSSTVLGDSLVSESGSAVSVNGVITATGNQTWPGALTTTGVVYRSQTSGLVVAGAGTSTDLYFANKSGTLVASVNTGTTTLAMAGNASVGGTLGVTGDFSVNTNKFAVTAASGNTSVAGTLSVTGTLTVTGATTLTSASLTANTVAYTLPSSQGAASTVLTNDGTGTLSWGVPSIPSVNIYNRSILL